MIVNITFSMFSCSLLKLPYSLLNLTMGAIKDGEEKVALQAVEFWTTVADEEYEVLDEGYVKVYSSPLLSYPLLSSFLVFCLSNFFLSISSLPTCMSVVVNALKSVRERWEILFPVFSTASLSSKVCAVVQYSVLVPFFYFAL